jgi:hypothetical protein
MNEYISATIVLNKTIALCIIEPFYCSFTSHKRFNLLFEKINYPFGTFIIKNRSLMLDTQDGAKITKRYPFVVCLSEYQYIWGIILVFLRKNLSTPLHWFHNIFSDVSKKKAKKIVIEN